MRLENLSIRPSAGPRTYDAVVKRMAMKIEQLETRIAELEKVNAHGGVIVTGTSVTGKRKAQAV